jgi:cell shape-determining protein MreC
MKKIFSTRRNALLSSVSLSWGAGVVGVVILLVLVRLGAPDFFARATLPFLSYTDTVSTWVSSVRALLARSVEQAKQLTALQEERSVLVVKNEELAARVATLERLSGISHREAGPALSAPVLVRPPESPYDVLIVGAGTAQGVTVQMVAFGIVTVASSTEIVPLGLVSETTDTTARVVLFSAPRVETLGWVGSTHTPVTLIGTGGGTFFAAVPREASPSVGESVFVPGSTVPIGVVARVESDPAAPSATIRITPLVNPFSISEVLLRPRDTSLVGAVSCTTPGAL